MERVTERMYLAKQDKGRFLDYLTRELKGEKSGKVSIHEGMVLTLSDTPLRKQPASTTISRLSLQSTDVDCIAVDCGNIRADVYGWAGSRLVAQVFVGLENGEHCLLVKKSSLLTVSPSRSVALTA